MAATLIFLKIKDAKGRLVIGESTAANYVGQIEVESFSWGMKADNSQKGDTQVSRQVQYDRLEITKYYDRSTTALCQMLAASVGGKVEPAPFMWASLSFVDIVFGRDESAGVPVLQIDISNGFVESVKLAASGSGKSMKIKETVTLSFNEVVLTYFTSSSTRSVTRGEGSSFQGEASSVDH